MWEWMQLIEQAHAETLWSCSLSADGFPAHVGSSLQGGLVHACNMYMIESVFGCADRDL